MKMENVLRKDNGELRCYRVIELINLETKGGVGEFLLNCYSYRRADMDIVSQWEDWLKEKNVPFAVIQHHGSKVTILKEIYH